MKRALRRISSSLRAKMLTMFVILTSIPLVTVGLISYQKSFNTLSAHSKASTILAADQLARDIDILIQDTTKLLELEKSQAVLQFLFAPTDSYEDAKEILRTFDLYRKTYKYDDILNITMVSLYGRAISERKGVFALDWNPLRNPNLHYLTQYPDDILILPPAKGSSLDRLDGFHYERTGVISIMATIKQRITGEVIGFILIDLNDHVIQAFTEHAKIGYTGYFYVVDADGEPVFTPKAYTPEQALPAAELKTYLASGSSSVVHEQDGRQTLAIFAASPASGWRIVGLVPLEEIVEDALEIRRLIIISVGLSILFIIGLYFFITARLTRPIQILKNKMRQASSGYLEAKVHPTGTDEIAELGNSFNLMIEQIKMLLQQSIREQEQLQKAELRTLQAQINPHFLYNTLDSIVWMAEAGQKDQVIRLVQALSRFFRISLNKGRDWISLQEELEHVRNYLVIQQIRYRDILDYELQIDPAIHHYSILKMTLQPIVENALYHGIKNKRGRGLIRISGKETAMKTIEIVVEDNGCGLSPTRLQELQDSMNDLQFTHEQMDNETGFGLRNVQLRLRLYYGEPYGVNIHSEEGKGTKVTIRIPVQRGDLHEENLSGR